MMCSCSQYESIRWFSTRESAIQHGLTSEGISRDDIIGTLNKDGECFVIYKKETLTGVAIGVVNIAEKDDKFTWYRSSNPAVVMDNDLRTVDVNWELTTLSNKTFTFYTGISHNSNVTIVTKNALATPLLNKENSVYYYIE